MKKTIPSLDRIAKAHIKRKVLWLFAIVFAASAALIAANFYTLRITSGIRAFIGGESEFSKSQKDAFLYLSNFILSEDEHLYTLFTEEITVPKGDNMARQAFTNKGTVAEIKRGFLMGRNNPKDLDNMIWLYRNFENNAFMRPAIKVWQDAEPLINEASVIGNEAHNKIKAGILTAKERQGYVSRINTITAQLSIKERIFSTTLSNTARYINNTLFWINVGCILLILGVVVANAVKMINRFAGTALALKQNNEDLLKLNKELDTFVYSASHDLRSPLASIKGLIELSLMEDEPETKTSYLHLMKGGTERLDAFIKDILDFFKHKRTEVKHEILNLEKLVDDAISLVRFIPTAGSLAIVKEIQADVLYSDELRIKIILNNLISNAIKFSDLKKEKRYVNIRTSNAGNQCIIEVEDNGIGIKQENQSKIFDMFYVTERKENSTGLGLYIVKETVNKLKGSIKVISTINVGTTFIVSLPNAN